MKIKQRLFIFISTLLLFFIIKGPVYANELIRSFSSDINIAQNAQVNVKETIIYDFSDNKKRGIVREIPLTQKNLEGKIYKIDLKVNNVYNELGTPYNYLVTENNNILSIKIGKENIFISGAHTYIIDYLVSGVITYFSDHDEFYWNVTGNDWQIPIEESFANVHLAFANSQKPKATCYTEKNISSCQSQVNSTNDISFSSTKIISPGDGLTIVVSFPKNLVAYIEPKEVTQGNIEINPAFAIILGIFIFIYYLLSPIIIFFIWYFYGRDPRVAIPLRAWFDPPKDKKGKKMLPAEVGTLIDERAENKDISATVVDLAVRGFLKIKEIKKNKEYLFEKLKNYSDSELLSYEKEIMDAFFKTRQKVKTTQLKNDFYKIADKVKNKLYERLIYLECFPKNPEKVRQKYLIIAIIVLFTGNIFLFLSLLIIGQVMPKKTLFGAKSQKTALGLKNFLSSQERQLKFQADKLFLFEKLLPYAIVFGVEKQWADRFKELMTSQPEWFESSYTQEFNSLVFVNSLTSATSHFSNIASRSSSTVSSSGFPSGFSGGSSGGGFGGGGGGSW